MEEINIRKALNDSINRTYQFLCTKDYWMADGEDYDDTPAFKEGVVYTFCLDPFHTGRHPITFDDNLTYVTRQDNHGDTHYMTIDNFEEGHFQLVDITDES